MANVLGSGGLDPRHLDIRFPGGLPRGRTEARAGLVRRLQEKLKSNRL